MIEPLSLEYEVWKQRDGTRIPVAEMEDSHIINTRNMLQRVLEKHMNWIERFNNELTNRGVKE